MSRQFAFVPSVLVALAAALSPSALLSATSPAAAAENCTVAPKPAAPQGSHWYYRLDRATQRKCWYLAQVDKKAQRTAARPAPQAAREEETAADDVQPAAPPPAAPVTRSVRTSPEPVQQPAPAWITRSASATTPEAAASQQRPGPLDGATAVQDTQAPASSIAAAAQEQTNTTVVAQAAAPVTEPPAQRPVAVTESAVVPTAAGRSMAQFAFVALAIAGLLASALFYFIAVRRRRGDVLNTVAHVDDHPSESTDAGDEPTFAPIPPINMMMPRLDDFDEAPRRPAQASKRRAA